ncbi:hypothetical protein L6452_31027 [Arctium lappa]|uniref:Uncharacterized protein n=1 Tax=Arctium lappa TaxID=4217 RepID=A0ACB8ZJP1_ARCLA|nr:hypothetical protein L6452_31027 [Arctium lappa]
MWLACTPCTRNINGIVSIGSKLIKFRIWANFSIYRNWFRLGTAPSPVRVLGLQLGFYCFGGTLFQFLID